MPARGPQGFSHLCFSVARRARARACFQIWLWCGLSSPVLDLRVSARAVSVGRAADCHRSRHVWLDPTKSFRPGQRKADLGLVFGGFLWVFSSQDPMLLLPHHHSFLRRLLGGQLPPAAVYLLFLNWGIYGHRQLPRLEQ